MHNLLRCRRGSAAFVTVVALVPLIGFLALGAEGGSWYVIKQHAQNAADAAAISGALRVACSISQSSTCDTTHDYVYRGKQFADQNGFCNPADTSDPSDTYTCANSPPTGTTQTVQIDQPASDRVRAIVSQQQPVYLASVLGLSTKLIGAEAIAKVQTVKNLCALGLGRWPSSQSALTIGGSANNTGTGCGMMSNATVKYASTPSFTGSGWGVYGANGCVNSGNCDPGVPYDYYMPPATNPLRALDNELFNNTTGSTPPPQDPSCPPGPGKCYLLTPNSTLTPNGAYGNLTVGNGDKATFNPGTYFFYNATIKITGGTVNGTGVTLVLLGNSSLSISGGTVNLSAPTTNTFSSDLNGVLIDDQAPNKSNNAVTVNGGGTVALGGAMYFPNVDVTWSGNVANSNTTCSEVIANSLTMSGSAYMNTDGCAPGTIFYTQKVFLVPS